MKEERKPKKLLILLIAIATLLIFFGILWIFLTSPVQRNSQEDIEVVITSGTSTRDIGNILKEKDLIRSSFVFSVYVKMSRTHNLKADTYLFHKSMSLGEIVDELSKGSSYNPDMVKLVFKEGLRITDYAKVISNNTNHTYEEVIGVFQNREYVKTLIPKYWFLTDVILDEAIYYPLEGYLSPDTYHFDNKDVEIVDIIEKMLEETDKKLVKYQSQIAENVHYYLTMASIVELEGTALDNRKMIVQIFKNRLNSGMNLGSDVTTYYGIQATMNGDLSSDQFASVNGYNTRSTTMIGKMPVGPICNVGESSIEASINPTDNDYLFFVADKKGNIYYTKTMKEHEQKIAEIKAKGDWIW